MKKIPITELALIIRTDFSDQAAWKRLSALVRKPAEPFIFNMKFLDDPKNSGATAKQILQAIPDNYPHSFIVVADAFAMSQPDHPLLLIDLYNQPGHEFRAIAAEVPSIENNLSIANMHFEEFADLVDKGGVFRGIS